MDKPIVLSVGDVFHLRRGKDRVIYAGMPSDNIYSIVQRKWDFMPLGCWGFAWNLFFPKKQQEITIDGVNIFVENVTPEAITLRIG
ncbi:MAG: hypothetical protein KAV68_04265 [Dehalococcoidales bacterium]|nr:hypothetical protein [Dehalococcoidales bacterium]